MPRLRGVDEAVVRAQRLIEEWDHELRRELPEGADIFDAHLHLGHDIDGMVGDYDELERVMERYGISRAFMFCMDEPDRHPAFQAPNDRTLEHGARSGGRLVPFVRLDLGERPIEEAERCLDLGARGIKLHPRAQKFLLIVAHAGIADLGALMRHFAGKPGVFFDTSAWSPIDLLDFFRQVSPEQVLYASDFPYGQQPSSLLIALRTARVSELTDDQIRDMLAGNSNRIAAGEPPLEPTA